MMRGLLALFICFCTLAFRGPAPAQSPASPFHDWAAVVIAGDTRASGGGATQAFENARRDVAAALLQSGFAPDNLRTLSLAAAAAPADRTTPDNLFAALHETARKAPGGCLLYLTSHGSPRGVVFGEALLTPRLLDSVLQSACRDRPTVVFISACYSGVFVPALAAPNRLLLTAARRDRTSFGCGEDDRYPFFDACVLQAWPQSSDFLALGAAVRGCVDRREQTLNLKPPSEPQISAGGRIRPLLPLLVLPGARPTG